MHLLFTTFTFAPQTNGVAEAVRAQAVGLAQRGHEVTVATSEDAGRPTASRPRDIRVVEFKITNTSQPDTEVRRYQEFIRTFPADAMLCHCWLSWPTDLAVPVLPLSSAKKLLISHGYAAHRWHPYPKFAWGLGSWLRTLPYVWRSWQTLGAFDRLVCLGARPDWNRGFDHWLARRRGAPPVEVIPNGTFPDQFEEAGPDFRREHGLRPDELMFLCVSTYAVGKNQAAALRAFRGAGLDQAVLVFIGHEFNDYARSVMELDARMAKAFPSGRVLFLERCSREMTRAAYRACDVFVMSSKAETQPLVLLDAMACGKPFVTTDVGCVAELPGGLVARNERALAAYLRLLYENPAQRQALGNQGKMAVLNRYNWRETVAAYDRLLARLVAETPGRFTPAAPAGRA
jgi:glycosyltransferase involved in cell wall biosynthesis